MSSYYAVGNWPMPTNGSIFHWTSESRQNGQHGEGSRSWHDAWMSLWDGDNGHSLQDDHLWQSRCIGTVCDACLSSGQYMQPVTCANRLITSDTPKWWHGTHSMNCRGSDQMQSRRHLKWKSINSKHWDYWTDLEMANLMMRILYNMY